MFKRTPLPVFLGLFLLNAQLVDRVAAVVNDEVITFPIWNGQSVTRDCRFLGTQRLARNSCGQP